jgi:hypothetical protein
VLEGVDLGQPSSGGENPAIGSVRLPARPVFAIGQAYFAMQDPAEYERTVAGLSHPIAGASIAPDQR